MNTTSPPKIDTGFPLPKGRNAESPLMKALRCLKPATGEPGDESIPWPDSRHPYWVANRIGIKIKTQKIDCGYRIWRVK